VSSSLLDDSLAMIAVNVSGALPFSELVNRRAYHLQCILYGLDIRQITNMLAIHQSFLPVNNAWQSAVYQNTMPGAEIKSSPLSNTSRR